MKNVNEIKNDRSVFLDENAIKTNAIGNAGRPDERRGS